MVSPVGPSLVGTAMGATTAGTCVTAIPQQLRAPIAARLVDPVAGSATEREPECTMISWSVGA